MMLMERYISSCFTFCFSFVSAFCLAFFLQHNLRSQSSLPIPHTTVVKSSSGVFFFFFFFFFFFVFLLSFQFLFVLSVSLCPFNFLVSFYSVYLCKAAPCSPRPIVCFDLEPLFSLPVRCVSAGEWVGGRAGVGGRETVGLYISMCVVGRDPRPEKVACMRVSERPRAIEWSPAICGRFNHMLLWSRGVRCGSSDVTGSKQTRRPTFATTTTQLCRLPDIRIRQDRTTASKDDYAYVLLLTGLAVRRSPGSRRLSSRPSAHPPTPASGPGRSASRW